MLTVSFYLGFIYNTVHYFIYPGYIKSHFYAGSIFWLHSLFGGAAAAGSLLYVSVVGYLGSLFLGKRTPYERIEQLVFSCTFLWILPLLISIPFLALGLTEPIGGVKEFCVFRGWFYVTYPVLIMGVIASIVTFNIFRRSLGFDPLRSLAPAVLVVPIGYFLGKGPLMFLTRHVLDVERSVRFTLGIGYFTLAGGIFYYIRGHVGKFESLVIWLSSKLGFTHRSDRPQTQ